MMAFASAGHDKTVTYEHEAVHRVDVLIRRFNECEEGRGRNALSLRGAARKGRGRLCRRVGLPGRRVQPAAARNAVEAAEA